MRKLLALILCAAAFLLSQPADADERILEMDVTGTVASDGSLTVTESLTVQVENKEINRGIIRNIPTHYTGTDSRRYGTEFSMLNASIDGKPTGVSVSHQSGEAVIRIGDPNAIISRGNHNITLTYWTRGWIASRDSFDELYWNVTGTEWAFPIDRAKFTLILPEGGIVSRSVAYTGKKGGRGEDYRTLPDGSMETARALAPGEGFTVAYGWNKGVVAPPPREKLSSRFGRPLFIAGAALAVILYYFTAWYLVGRDPDSRRIIPLYRPPKDVGPGFARFLKDMKFSDDCLAADIIQLATLGFIKFSGTSGASVILILPTEKIKDKGEIAALPESLSSLVTSLGLLHVKPGVRVDKDDEECGQKFKYASDKLKAVYEKEGRAYFRKNNVFNIIGLVFFLPFLLVAPAASATRILYRMNFGRLLNFIFRAFRIVSIASLSKSFMKVTGSLMKMTGFLVTTAVVLFTAYTLRDDIAMLCGLGAAGGAAFFFSRIMSAYTVEGARTMEAVKGLEMYMASAERHRLAMLFKPDETPQFFESLLPYAYALGCAETWADSFADTLRKASYVPEWDGRANWGRHNEWTFSDRTFRTLQEDIASSIKAYDAPRTPSGDYGGGSGFGGGGGVGGGGGGGGGRGW